MDGVLADFMGAIEHWFYQGRDWNDLKRSHDINQKRWTSAFRAKVKTKPDFWQSLPLMPGTNHLWSVIKPYHPMILSAYASWDEENSKRGKVIWAARYLRVPASRILLVTREDKVKYAAPDAILIDDYDKNIKEWKAHGGIGIQYTSAEQTVAELSKYGMK
jgi:hypothetical protein